MSLPEMARKRLNLVVGKARIRPNDVQKWKLMHDFGRYFNGPLSSQRIAAAIFKDIVNIYCYFILAIVMTLPQPPLKRPM